MKSVSEENNYGFGIPLNTAVFTTTFVLKEKKDIILVHHHEDDGAWVFQSGDEYKDFEQIAMLVSLEEIINYDPSIIELSSMQEGYFAVRKTKMDPWIVKKIHE